jgi:dihydrofolate reductase
MAHRDFEADVYFPEINFNEWNELSRETLFDEKNNFNYSNIDLERI